MSRTRSRETDRFTGGTLTHKYGYTTSIPGQLSGKEWMTDTPSGSLPYPDKPADKKTWEMTPGRINGQDARYGTYQYAFDNVPWDYDKLSVGTGVFLDWASLKAEALASFQVQPVVDIPLFLYELREIPRMLRDTGKALDLRSSAGDAWLTYSFGWAPLYSDLRKLLDLGAQMEEEVHRLKKGKLRKRLEGGLSGSNLVHPPSGFGTYSKGYCKIDYALKTSSSTSAWYVAKFIAYDPPPDIDTSGLNQVRHALGLKGVSPSTLWNMIPWTWLIDYFTNLGDMIAARNNTVQYELESLCIMQRCEITTRTSIIDKRYIEGSVTAGKSKTTAWERRVYWDDTLNLHIGSILNPNQVANIAALVTSSRGRY